MSLFFQRKQAERDGAYRLLRGCASTLNEPLRSLIFALPVRDKLEQTGRELGTLVQQAFEAQAQQLAQAQNEASHYRQNVLARIAENERERKAYAELSTQLTQCQADSHAQWKRAWEAEAEAKRLKERLEAEQRARAVDVARLEQTITDLRRITAKQELELLNSTSP